MIKSIHYILYKGKLKDFDLGYYYEPHITVGKVDSLDILNKAFDEVKNYEEIFTTVIDKISVEMIGENEESIIIIEHELK